MTMELRDGVLVCSGALTVEDAEALLQLLNQDVRTVDLAACAQVHAASLQALMAAALPVAAWPADGTLAPWLRAALDKQGE
ncbi:hypothetical protein ACLB1G_23125 [Oxalobacteraceae bacterium A2-2]